jgi:SpoVK/Ycf46/Vps4 family AAA+-type ATPase
MSTSNRNLQIQSSGKEYAKDETVPSSAKSKVKTFDAPKFIQWVTHGSGVYYPEFHVDVVDEIPTGFYNIGYDSNQAKHFVRKTSYTTDNVLELPMPETQAILKDITGFWTKEQEFKKYGLTFKRGVLMCGPAGCGKSHVIQLIIKYLIEREKGVVFKLETPQDVETYSNFMHSTFKIIEKTRRIVTIIEDIDGLFHAGKATETLLLNILDGMNHMDNIVYLATTNYPEELAERIMNRPSRFDRIYEIGLPNDEVRKFYLENTLLPEDLEKIDINLWVKESDKLSIAHLRELIVSTVIQGNPFEEIIKMLQEQNKNRHHSKRFGGAKTIGFGGNN